MENVATQSSFFDPFSNQLADPRPVSGAGLIGNEVMSCPQEVYLLAERAQPGRRSHVYSVHFVESEPLVECYMGCKYSAASPGVALFSKELPGPWEVR